MKCKILTRHGGIPDRMFDKKLLLEGMRVELEHTTSHCLAKQIAKDHLIERRDYYKRLRMAKL